MAQQPQITARPLTPKDITAYGLPTGTQVSAGLLTVGVGTAVYLEAQVLKGTPVSAITWDLSNKPAGSAALLATSPLGTNVPSFEPSERLEYDVAGRQLLVPDVKGQYTVTATVSTNGSNNIVLSRVITAANYVGVGLVDGANVATGRQCAVCHDGGLTPDKTTSWSKTAHAGIFAEGIDGIASDHYGPNCIKCHTLGYNTALTSTNGGFDDVATQVGWSFPTNLTVGNWAALPTALKQVSNIQCENCHGPGSEHGGNKAKTSVSFSAGDCAQCHSSGNNHIKSQEWANSKHAVAVREESASCAGCHSGIGFIDRIEGASTVRTNYAAITCATCHDPHDDANPHQLRTTGVVTLKDTSRPGGATVITNGGPATLCMQCHMSRRDAVTYVNGTGSSHFGPHRGPQTDMLMGVNAITYGKQIPSSGHGTVVTNACVTCHMQAVASTNAVFLQAGGHTFNVSAGGLDLVTACQNCHGSTVTSLNFAREDYDGNGVIEGVQTEVQGLLDKLAMMLPPIGQPTVSITAAYTPKQLKAVYNYQFVFQDGSKGVHNTAYAVGLLKASIADLIDDADNDGLPDSWEIANFGSIQVQNAQGDADQDGVSNALERAAGTNPNLADSDNDSYSDQAEMLAGSDPLNQSDTPGFSVKIYNAAELVFASQVDKTYQVQKVSELTGAWLNVGNPVPGTGELIGQLICTRTNIVEFYRVKESP